MNIRTLYNNADVVVVRAARKSFQLFGRRKTIERQTVTFESKERSRERQTYPNYITGMGRVLSAFKLPISDICPGKTVHDEKEKKGG